MTSENQRTIAQEIKVAGIGIHCGATVEVGIAPAAPGTGIVFRRTDVVGAPDIPARLEYVTSTELGTGLGSDGVEVRTVEHLLAALAALEVDNAVVRLDGPEAPILDGSFAVWTRMLRDAGLVSQPARSMVFEIGKAVSVSGRDGQSYAALPHRGLRVSATIEFDHTLIGRQYGDFSLDGAGFEREIAAARTFGFHEEADGLRARGFARGASLENTVVLDRDGVMNGDLRYPDEFLRHKVGDLVGDLSLIGGRLRGHIVADRPSHAGNVALARTILASQPRRAEAPEIDIRRIMEYLPHRYPMLLVDRILEFEPRKRIIGLKNVTINEPFFRGHFPEHPIMPGVLIVEAMAQVGGLLLMDAVDNPEEKVVYFMSLNNVKWRRPVTPGDQVVFEVEMQNLRRRICRMKGKGIVDGKVVAEAEMTARIVDR
ncbi:MAG: bifunctional UDP-3-O-[3-hydroxymyristoyl] N-acetylglucosamine deacetylase/3-hydroxyacyl-ACP dehydratase [Gemmatimonadota bacterium]|nr:bifunctional UDP-3-O-[3-hydroxymyristoyl] N-acetylglucosamine deacetylase/3-hydroxyacyl-ACP dehydratase [Gemmatimonadota bacterium]